MKFFVKHYDHQSLVLSPSSFLFHTHRHRLWTRSTMFSFFTSTFLERMDEVRTCSKLLNDYKIKKFLIKIFSLLIHTTFTHTHERRSRKGLPFQQHKTRQDTSCSKPNKIYVNGVIVGVPACTINFLFASSSRTPFPLVVRNNKLNIPSCLMWIPYTF